MKENTSYKNLLIIFTRNPEIGKVKSRLAKDIGEKAALDIYRFLLEVTASATRELQTAKEVHYSERIEDNDLWDSAVFSKELQQGNLLGEKMKNAFKQGFSNGYERIVIIGSDLYDLQQSDLEKAFDHLKDHQYVIGPAKDGGYYLLGMNSLNPNLFRNKNWGTNSVLEETLNDIRNDTFHLLDEKNDIDTYEDIENLEVFQKFLK